MRKRRAILFDDDRSVLKLLAFFFDERGYEVIACPEPVACPVYEETARCDKLSPCGDIMITDLVMPGMSGAELLELQARRGCRLDARNKALLSGSLTAASLAVVRRLGCASFQKPFRLAWLEAWVDECEGRMDLSRPLGIKRRERREACCDAAVVSVGPQGDRCLAEVVNRSDSGFCLLFGRQLEPAQELEVRASRTGSARRFVVRWTKPAAAGGCLAGGFLS